MRSSAIDLVRDPELKAGLHAAIRARINALMTEYGSDAFVQPRPLAVAHETGHVVTAIADTVVIEYAEVSVDGIDDLFLESEGRIPTNAERQRIGSIGDEVWGGWTRFDSSPFDGDIPPSRFDALGADFDTFRHYVTMLLGGICGETVLYDGKVPKGSSLDELVLAQQICLARARGDTAIARSSFTSIWQGACETIARHRATAEQVIEAFNDNNRVDGERLHAIFDQHKAAA